MRTPAHARGGPILAANFGPPEPIFVTDQIFHDTKSSHAVFRFVNLATPCMYKDSKTSAFHAHK